MLPTRATGALRYTGKVVPIILGAAVPLSALIMIILLACACGIMLARGAGVVFVGHTKGGLTIVHDDTHVVGQRIRVLEVAGTYQSATYLDERWAEPVFRYHWLFDHLFEAWPDGSGPTSVALLGGGGYAVPKHFVAHHPEIARLDVVELDPAIERIARRHFFLDRLEERFHAEAQGRLRLHVGDAHAWLAGTDQTFDAIVNDCFLALDPVSSLMTVGAAELIHARLTPGGLYLANVVSALEGPDARTLNLAVSALSQAFEHVWVYPCSPNQPALEDNNVVIASDVPHDFPGAWEWPT